MPMPPPPPPGPPPPGPPPPPVFNTSNSKLKGSGADNRGALLQSIRHGANLKKTVTVDKSAPLLSGKVSGSNNSNNDVGRNKSASNSSNTSSQPVSNGIVLGGLFAGGMPKLRSTGLRPGPTQPTLQAACSADVSRRPSPEMSRPTVLTAASNTSQLNEVLKRQMAGDIRNRGPPPQPPAPRNNVADPTDSSTRSIPSSRSSPESPVAPVANKSSLHKNGSGGNTGFLHQYTQQQHSNGAPARPAPSHGKPNVAPKPPPLAPNTKPATPPKKLVMNGRVPVSRAQSMRVPRSPPVAPPTNPPFPPSTVNGKDFGTIRGLPTAFHQSQENLSGGGSAAGRSSGHPHHSRNQTLPVNLLKNTAPQPPSLIGSNPGLSRPSGPPPGRPPVPPPPSRTASNVNLKAPLSPPPPPPVAVAPTPPPPPPHRTSPAPPPPIHTRPPPAIPIIGPPPPPVRNSSMRNGGSQDFDTRFSNLFHPVTDFPSPSRFKGLPKIYSSKNGEYVMDWLNSCPVPYDLTVVKVK